ncbi:MAG: peroxiredoxin-like (seleno)protein, partial [Deltaproteobacteria bacterium]|nr:peroxiredoxin-like (seleno)protein [Deltaproteobacteria bacterium]
MQVLKPDGTNVRLGDYWIKRPTLLVFLRHFGCMGCSQHVNELSPRLLELYNLGMRTVFVGNGEP